MAVSWVLIAPYLTVEYPLGCTIHTTIGIWKIQSSRHLAKLTIDISDRMHFLEACITNQSVVSVAAISFSN